MKGLNRRLDNAKNHMANRQTTELITMYRERKMSYLGIVKRLNQNGFKTRWGNHFNASTVRRLYLQEKST